MPNCGYGANLSVPSCTLPNPSPSLLTGGNLVELLHGARVEVGELHVPATQPTLACSTHNPQYQHQ